MKVKQIDSAQSKILKVETELWKNAEKRNLICNKIFGEKMVSKDIFLFKTLTAFQRKAPQRSDVSQNYQKSQGYPSKR